MPVLQMRLGLHPDDLHTYKHTHKCTAIIIHRCPFCKRGFDYSPDDFHRKISCGNKGCDKPFGFMLYPVSESRLKQLRDELKEAQEKRIKRQEAIMRRNARAVTQSTVRGTNVVESDALKLEEDSFRHGLVDVCPRCGWEVRLSMFARMYLCVCVCVCVCAYINIYIFVCK